MNVEVIQWYQTILFKLLVGAQDQGSPTAQGIALQLTDIFVGEVNKVFSSAKLETLAQLLDPFLKTLGQLSTGELKQRIIEHIFNPLFKHNGTETVNSDDEDEEAKEAEMKK